MAATGGSSSSEQTVTATGVHVVFTQPVNQPGVPAQYVEHILGEVFVDSLAAPAPPLPNLDLSSSSSSSLYGVAGSGSASSSCAGGGRSGHGASSTSAVGGSSTGGTPSSTAAGGSAASGSLSPSGSALGAATQPLAGSTGMGSGGNSLPAAFAALLKKPLWLLLAYVLWQAIVIGTGASLWNWRREDAP